MAQASFCVIAHRGCSEDVPENTLQAFEAAEALLRGACHFELDAQLTRDGVAVVLHDERLGRTVKLLAASSGGDTAAAAAVSDVGWPELRQADAGSWKGAQWAHCRVPSLESVLQRFKSTAHIHLELKSKQAELPGAVAQLLRETGWAADMVALPTEASAAPGSSMPQAMAAEAPAAAFAVPGLTVTSFHLNQLRASLQLLPHVRHGWLVQELTDAAMQEAAAAGVRQLCPRADTCTPETVGAALARGFSVRAWGVKTVELLHHVVACGVQGATVNWPARALEALQQDTASG